MNISVNVLNPKSIQNAVDKLRAYAAKLRKLEEELPKALCDIGKVTAKANFDSAPYDILLSGGWSNANIFVDAVQTDEGWSVTANGEEVCFIEFGAGVWYNGAESYQGTRPDGVVGIGEYGKGQGKRNVWAFINKAGEKTFTQGTPASNAMYYASQEMRRRIVDEARRLLTND